MSGYVGLKVCIVLVDNRRCEGIIAAVDPVTQKITLQDGKNSLIMEMISNNLWNCFFLIACFQSKSTSYANQRLPFITISGAEVHDIQILENMKPKSKVPDDPAIIQVNFFHFLSFSFIFSFIITFSLLIVFIKSYSKYSSNSKVYFLIFLLCH